MTEAGALDAIDRILNRGGDADDVLRDVVRILPQHVPELVWAGVYFEEQGRLVAGPASGEPDESRRVVVGADARHDLPLFGTEVDAQHEQPVGVGVRLGGADGAHPELEGAERFN